MIMHKLQSGAPQQAHRCVIAIAPAPHKGIHMVHYVLKLCSRDFPLSIGILSLCRVRPWIIYSPCNFSSEAFPAGLPVSNQPVSPNQLQTGLLEQPGVSWKPWGHHNCISWSSTHGLQADPLERWRRCHVIIKSMLFPTSPALPSSLPLWDVPAKR